MALDKRAVRILTTTYWSSAGWVRDPKTSAEDFAYAKLHGTMFDPHPLSHDEVVAAAISAVRKAERSVVVDAFVASLSSRRLDLRSALGSYAVGRHLAAHVKKDRGPSPSCTYCGGYDRAHGDLNVLNFERIKWGGVRHDQPEYIAFDLDRLPHSFDIWPQDSDVSMLRTIVEIAGSMPAKARLSDLDKALAQILPSNSAERRTLIGILGFAGVLIDSIRPDFRLGFVPAESREQTPWHKDDWPYPVQWWNGSHGVNAPAVAEWFPFI